jgi:hypothetical protein
MRQARIALAAGLTLTALGVCLVLSGSPPAATRTKTARTKTVMFWRSDLPGRICQAEETLPRGSTAIRIWLEAVIGPPVSIEVLARGRVVAQGAHGAGWTAGSVTIPLKPISQTVSPATVCVHVSHLRESFSLQGSRTPPARADIERQGPVPPSARGLAPTYREGPLPGRVTIEYLKPGDRSWWSLALSVARRMGLGHAFSGSWIALLAIVLMLAVAVTMSRLLLKELT